MKPQEPPRLYTSNKDIAKVLRKAYPGVEVVITPKQIPVELLDTHPHLLQEGENK